MQLGQFIVRRSDFKIVSHRDVLAYTTPQTLFNLSALINLHYACPDQVCGGLESNTQIEER
ncbi:hypothetical protein ANRL3_00504 [Anaerolineae bacterium]|nr:hypothetical protein ANRL3_00504 [Anaerolineae bacterium]